ncbi:hypothetical protein CsatB_004541 [Cannabis sativa]
MSIHSTRRVTISVVTLFVLLGLVIGTYASRALLHNDGLNSGAAAAYGSGINGATQYGVGGGIGGAGATGGEYGGGGMGGGEGEAGGSGGSSIGFAAKEEYATNNRGGGLHAFFDTNGAPGYAGRGTSESVVGKGGSVGGVGGGIRGEDDSRSGTTEEGLGVEGEDRGGLGRGGEYAAKDEYATNERGDGTIQ